LREFLANEGQKEWDEVTRKPALQRSGFQI
jgi:hypothetical protein